ncbi:MAG: DUF1553 domain-containing protein [Planctomycetaceae bacterium]|nr:MAG: DUF1553 domain-containing protein [Planctomycetaceae bacterium]
MPSLFRFCKSSRSFPPQIAIGLVVGSLILGSSLFAPASAVADEELTPVAHWRFANEETSKLVSVGGVVRGQAGPRPPEFPDFDTGNTAIKLDGRGGRLTIADTGPDGPFDFAHGDAITLEAWVNVDQSLGQDRHMYVVGKGRTGDSRFPADNQNWALRLRGVDGQARINFLFASEKDPQAAKRDAHWHRWTSDQGFFPGTGWHRIAIRYRFGDPTSIRAWLNEKQLAGKWDMGGATDKGPVVDDDAVWIGSSMGGGSGASFEGLLDEVSVFRGALSDEVMARRYRREGPDRLVDSVPEVLPQLTLSPTGVTVRVIEGVPSHENWTPIDARSNEPLVTYDAESFLFKRLPNRFDEWGVRASWRPTVLLQAAAEVDLPAGEHELLVRTRGVGRVWLNDEVIARVGTRRIGGSAHGPVNPLPDPPAEGHRRVGYGDLEKLVRFVVPQDGSYRMTLETFVGGPRLRAEPGETLLAIRPQGSRDFTLVQPRDSGSAVVRVMDNEIEAAVERAEQRLVRLDDQIRRRASAGQDDHWLARHEVARAWVESNPGPAIPELSGRSFDHPIDAFLAAKVVSATESAATQAHGDVEFFHREVQPILRDHCFRCHDENAEGGLRLSSREAVLVGGDSGEPAVVPHDLNAGELLARVRSTDESERMPPAGGMTPEQIATLERWIEGGVSWGRVIDPQAVTPSPLIDDAAFLRRVYLDCWGVPPTDAEARAFLANTSPNKRTELIDRLLADERVADQWVSYWQDVLAENPNMLKPSINNTGPFRYFVYDALRDNLPMDRLVTDLVMLRGSEREGGAAGFGLAADNDAPLATRGLVLASAFLGIDLNCARCHDSPYHSTKQQDLFALSAMLARKPVTVPKTSSVSPGFFEQHKGRESLIRVTLQPGVPVDPQWPFASATGASDGDTIAALMQDPKDTRERLATLITAPQNERFASVIVNRVWKRLLGAGLIEPADDWEAKRASHPELLVWLGRQWVASGYDLRSLMRLVMTSDAYQREATGNNLMASAEDRFFAAPDRRRLTAEQVVDSLFHASGHTMRVDELTFDQDGMHAPGTMITLGKPRRAWQFATLSNERDRPSLALPRAQAVTDVLEAFGWNGSRQNALTQRDTDPNVLQPGILSNGVMASWITRASVDSELAHLAIVAPDPETLVETLFLRFLSRTPTDMEREEFTATIRPGFEQRRLPSEQVVYPEPPEPLSHVSWANHLRSEANLIKVEMERRAREGDPVDPRLAATWREAYEDIVWSLTNSPEFVWVP